MNHVGVSPAANSEASWEETPALFVRASAIREEGRAVWRTETTDNLEFVCVSESFSREWLVVGMCTVEQRRKTGRRNHPVRMRMLRELRG